MKSYFCVPDQFNYISWWCLLVGGSHLLLLFIPTRRFNLGWKNGARAVVAAAGWLARALSKGDRSVCHQRFAFLFEAEAEQRARMQRSLAAHSKCGLEFV
jgi:hypothetical protein